MAMRRGAIADDFQVALGDVAMELQRAALGRTLGMHGQRQDGADVRQVVGDRRIFLGRDIGVVPGALQFSDDAVELGSDHVAALDPEGLHKKVRVAIHIPSSIFMIPARPILASCRRRVSLGRL
jgi:hypothetical protein